MTLSDIDRIGATATDATDALQMDEDTFRAFYDRTARGVWAYLSRMTGDRRLADDLLQETYYRFLRASNSCADDAHRRNYLFRIATNLVHDHHRRLQPHRFEAVDDHDPPAPDTTGDSAARTARRIDLARAMDRLKPRERDLLWLAYANGSSHEEIASSLGLKTASIKGLLFRARRRLASLLTDKQIVPASEEKEHRGHD
jgi:RNA polymerase sigma-70 factor (ECF subfamily)